MRGTNGKLKLALLAGAFIALPAFGQEGYTVRVAVEGVRSSAGALMANLCSDAQQVFCATYRARAAATPAGTELVFEGVAPGRYTLRIQMLSTKEIDLPVEVTAGGTSVQDYRLKKELWGFRGNRMAVKFFYEWHDDSGQWFRSYGNELWQFAPSGLMERREASINDMPIGEGERLLR